MPFERVEKLSQKTSEQQRQSFNYAAVVTSSQAPHTNSQGNLEVPQFHHNFAQIPVRSTNLPIQAKLTIEQPADRTTHSVEKTSTYSPYTQIFRSNSTRQQTDSFSIIQLAAYKALKPINGINMEVTINHEGNKIEIEDLTKSDKPVGKLSGYIEYEIDEDNSLRLNHFEAQPAGTGLGTLLMNVFAQFAVNNKFRVIYVNNPALTAMGAYEAFGGIPSRPDTHADLFKAYYEEMRATRTKHENFVQDEAKELASHEVSREKYFNPGIDKEKEAEIREKASKSHIEKHTSEDDIIRVANLKALSFNLMYDSKELLNLTEKKLAGKWTEIGQESKSKSPLSGFFSGFFSKN